MTLSCSNYSYTKLKWRTTYIIKTSVCSKVEVPNTLSIDKSPLATLQQHTPISMS